MAGGAWVVITGEGWPSGEAWSSGGVLPFEVGSSGGVWPSGEVEASGGVGASGEWVPELWSQCRLRPRSTGVVSEKDYLVDPHLFGRRLCLDVLGDLNVGGHAELLHSIQDALGVVIMWVGRGVALSGGGGEVGRGRGHHLWVWLYPGTNCRKRKQKKNNC